ncbi:MAG: hypothetical protein RBS88_07920 [Spongiibacteraceae bacterium]|jgi:hypothetical protein|nr:hypothetical protein [Spongiibacteraceae bacterium]
MAAGTSGAKEKTSTEEDFLEDDEDEGSVDFDEAPEETVVPVALKDPSIRRKIEDRLERIRLRDELGIFDADWDDI